MQVQLSKEIPVVLIKLKPQFCLPKNLLLLLFMHSIELEYSNRFF